MKKIVIISPFQFRLQRGIERFTYSLANTLANLGHEIVIYSYSKKQAYWGNDNSKVRYRITPKLKYYEGYLAVLFFRWWLIKDKPDSIILNFLYHGEIYLPKNLNYLYVLHSPASQIPNRFKFIQLNEHKFYNLKYIAVSKMVLNEAKLYLKKEISQIYLGADLNLFRPVKNKLSAGNIKFLSTAAFEERKGIQFFIWYLAQNKPHNFEYHIYGAGPYQHNIIELIEEYKLQNNVFIHEPTNSIHSILPSFDIYVLLSKGESFGLGWLEAAACGLPVLVSNFDPYPELINNSFGRQVNPQSTVEIENAINSIVSNYSDMSNEACKASLEYNWSKIASKYLEILK